VIARRGSRNESEAESLLSARRTLAVLEALAARPEGATPKELSQTLDLHLSTCYRLLNTLAAAGYAVRGPGGGLFQLGPRVAFLYHGYMGARRPSPETLAFLHALQLATGETAMLSQLAGDEVVVLAVVPGSRAEAHPPGYVGIGLPAHILAAGKALVAWLPAARIEAFLGRLTSASEPPIAVPDPTVLRGELEQIRLCGYAVDRGGIHPDVCCVAAPIVNRGAAKSAVAVVAPCHRFLREESALVATVLAVARTIGALQTTTHAGVERTGDGRDEPERASQAAIAAAQAILAQAMSKVS
jgi:DNA-binding IclR family transcriptional regulator